MSVLVWADTHFNHRGILRHTSRNYRSVTEMNEALIQRWNWTVSDRDDIWLLGDFAFRAPNDPEAMDLDVLWSRLNGRKHLVVGNHDERNPHVLRLPWMRTERLLTLRDSGRRAELCHYALASWKGAQRGAIMIHGHSHGNLPRMSRRFDVGADVFHNPIPVDALWRVAEIQPWKPQDHH